MVPTQHLIDAAASDGMKKVNGFNLDLRNTAAGYGGVLPAAVALLNRRRLVDLLRRRHPSRAGCDPGDVLRMRKKQTNYVHSHRGVYIQDFEVGGTDSSIIGARSAGAKI